MAKVWSSVEMASAPRGATAAAVEVVGETRVAVGVEAAEWSPPPPPPPPREAEGERHCVLVGVRQGVAGVELAGVTRETRND